MSDDVIPISTLCRVLEIDPDLADCIPAERREQAVQECLVREMEIPAGRWQTSSTGMPDEGIGLLVLGGLLIRRVGVEGRFASELLGEGDLLRPWQGEGDSPILSATTGWRVLQPSRLAVLDSDFQTHIVRYPELASALVGRAMARSRNQAISAAIIHQARVDVRLQMLFWHLAARWGRVRTGEVWLPLRLTHAVLAEIAAARRPTVTSALSELARRGIVLPAEEGGWLLVGEPPGELNQVAEMKSAGARRRVAR